ncbi:PhzF family phenazine biosynthesis protein [Arthrobacter sp. Soil762]|uniref:PhzF family phenazine biosynthesis protein n=1 Tax=Arthrobacter sp. Soil762 TaxID=1736401 RepID=UPI0006F51D4B|nr:PhzF family phenazine biosynthesis protein [Arthrobacter sp. Soil762]KRE71061.1 isomerase [Arthrobacter sp. Soil762]
MHIPLIQIDAFATKPFEGNPAAVMPLEGWLVDSVLQQLAEENNLSETAFIVADIPDNATPFDFAQPAYHLRWFTPAIEVDLCGHATLATASYLFTDVHPDAKRLQFWSRSGWLFVERDGDGFILDFPSETPEPVAIDPSVTEALGVPALEAFLATDLIHVVKDAETVRTLTPDFGALAKLSVRGVVVTAAGDGTGYDFVSRFFGARAGIDEDPVTGSAHSQLAPLWAGRLGSTVLAARQLSARGGTVLCRVEGERTLLSGTCVPYLEGTVHLADEVPAG